MIERRYELLEEQTLTGKPAVTGPSLAATQKPLAAQEFDALIDDLDVIVGRRRECCSKVIDRARPIEKRYQFDDGITRTKFPDPKIAEGNELEELIALEDQDAVP